MGRSSVRDGFESLVNSPLKVLTQRGHEISILNHQCGICDGTSFKKLTFNSLLFPTSTSNPGLHSYGNYLCAECGVVCQYPQIGEAKLVEYYNTANRLSNYAIDVGAMQLDVPIAIPWSGVSFQRFQTFFNSIDDLKDQTPVIIPTEQDTIIDFGAYQGVFLYAAKKLWNCRAIAYDYNRAGIEFAKKALDIDEAILAHDIYTDTFGIKSRFVTLIHAFEHLRDPGKFLAHLRQNLLLEDGFLYLEIPNLYGTPLSDPTHLFTYSIDCLTYLLKRNGFRVLRVEEHGQPDTEAVHWRNSRMNISVVAQVMPSVPDVPSPNIDTDKILEAIRKQYRSLVRRMVWNQALTTIRSFIRLIYHIVFILLLEKLSYRFASKLKGTVTGWLRRGRD
jgi:hypothetical protein